MGLNTFLGLWQKWTSNMKNIESGLTPTQLPEEDTELPPIRSGSITLTAEGVSIQLNLCKRLLVLRDHLL